MGLENEDTFPQSQQKSQEQNLKPSEMKSSTVTAAIEAPHSRPRGTWISSADLCISSEIFWWGP